MSPKFYTTFIAAVCIACTSLHAQNIFPSIGRTGIYTTSPITSLQVKGGARIGTTANYVNIDSATGQLSFAGTGAYQVAGNKYAFQYTGNPNYGLFFNSSSVQYEFRNGSAVPVFSINANTGNSVFNGTLKVGAYTLPATDGTNGQVLKTNGTGALTWSADNNTTYTAGTGLSLSGTTFTNTAPDKTVALTAGTGISVTGTYPSFTITNTGSSNGAWSLTGNAGTDSAVNFIGTTDAHPLVFRVNNVRAGYIGYGKSSTSFGYNALSAITTGNYNTATGTYALAANTSGYNNTAQGSYALANDSSGSFNTAMGSDALHNNTTGNTNTATGNQALYNNTIGSSNTANGFASLYHNTTGYSNVAVGIRSLYSNTTATSLVAIGDSALYNNGIGAVNIYDGWYNNAIGSNALFSNTTGNENIANGAYVLYSNTTGIGNTAEGSEALYGNSTGLENTSIGYISGNANTTGNANTYVGEFAGPNGDYDGSTAIGGGSTISSSHQIRVGDNTATSIGGYANWTNISDGRVKKNIKQNVPGLAFINKLNPVTYNLDLDVADKIIQRPQIKDKVGKAIQSLQFEIDARKAKEQIVYTGFVAQDVEKAAKSLNYDFSGVDAAKNDKDLYGLRYAEFVVPLVKAVQELSTENDSLKNEMAIQQQINNNLETRLAKLESMMNVSNQSTVNNQQSTVVSSASLQQNIPNPFTNTTVIGYTLPQKFTSAQILISDKNGVALKAITISGSGKGSLTVSAPTLYSGAYQYSLIVDGRLVDTKQMVLAK